jgi:hypothetical protein
VTYVLLVLLLVGLFMAAYSHWIWSGIVEKVVGTAGHNIPAEIEYVNRKGEVIGFWAYGYFDPNYPYQGD